MVLICTGGECLPVEAETGQSMICDRHHL